MKRLFKQNENSDIDWKKYLGIKSSASKDAMSRDLQQQVNENGIYAVFDKANSKEELNRRHVEKSNEYWKRAGIVVTAIGVLVAIGKLFY